MQIMINFEDMQSFKYISISKVKILLALLSILTFAASASEVKGKINIDESWEPVIYLSVINSFDDFNTASYDFLVYQAPIDSSGQFYMKVLNLPSDDRIYRLHICKKDDPVSTIIIGGRDENFIHFIMNDQSRISIYTDTENPFFQHSIVEGNQASKSLGHIMNLQKELHIPPSLPSKQNREFAEEKVISKFYNIADTSSHPIVVLLALHMLNQYIESPELALMEATGKKLQISDSSNPYYLSFVKQLDYLKYRSEQTSEPIYFSWIKWAGVLLVLLIILFVVNNRFGRKPVSNTINKDELIRQLSVQEKRVFDLIREGASNKEISSELNIEVSTVKSHVYKIFSRLGVRSRKEIINKDW